MALNFERYANDGNRFIHELAVELKYNNEPQKAGRILRSVLHTLRDHLTIEESLQLLAQLPMFLKAVYVDGWSSKKKKKVRHLNDFLSEIWKNDGFVAADDFGDGQETLAVTVMIFLLLRKYVSEGEMNDIVGILPKELKPIINPSYAV